LVCLTKQLCVVVGGHYPTALDDGRVVSNFVKQALEGVPMTVYGDGSQTRSFQYVSDLVAGLVSCNLHSHQRQSSLLSD
jgi:nucleoside-diphosphate-sugar epimerase